MSSLAVRIKNQFLGRRKPPLLIALAISQAFAFSACIPKNAPLPEETVSASKDYGGFKGALKAETMGADKVRITWEPSADPEVIAYNIYDSSNLFTPTLLKTVPAPASSITLTGLLPQQLYAFRVRAANIKAVEDENMVDVRAIPYGGIVAANVNSSTSATIEFNDGSNADEIHIYCQVGASEEWTLMRKVLNVALTQATLSPLENGTTYNCRVALQVADVIDDNTQAIQFTPIGQATQMLFTTQPGSAGAGQALSPQPVIEIRDANDNIVSAGPDSTALITLEIAGTSPTAGSIRGTAAVAAVKGVATFNGLNFRETGVKILSATKSDTSTQVNGSAPLTVTSNNFTISAGPVSPLLSLIEVSPASGTVVANGSSNYTTTITLADEFGNPIAGVKPQFASTNSSDTITQPTANTNASGVSTGSISSTIAGTRSISISSPSGLNAVSIPLVFIPGPPTKVAFTTQPVNSPAGAGGLNNLQVAVQDQQGNVVTSSTATITLSIFVNPGSGALSGTNSAAAVNGVATISGLGISATGTGYKLVANSAPLAVAYSNSFNVTAGVPSRLAITGPAMVMSGACSTAFDFKLQDPGGNPANATANTSISLSGLGQGGFYASSACTGAPVGSTITFASGSNKKTYFFKDNKAEALTITASDPASVLTSATLGHSVTPSQVALAGPTTVVSGQCSAAYTITTSGVNNQAGPVAAPTVFSINGLTGTQASLYTSNTCAGSPVNPAAITMPASTSVLTLYLKDNKAENLTLGIVDPDALLTTASSNLAVAITASKIVFTGPASVVSGRCSTAYTVGLRDAANNAVLAPAATGLKIDGVSTTQGAFYLSSSCAGSPLGVNAIIPLNSSQILIYFRDSTAENIAISISDPATVLATSATINIGVSPSDFALVGPIAGSANTNVCAGPFTIEARDGAGNQTAAITPITANLTGGGAAGTFYSDAGCTSAVTSLLFATGVSQRTFYLRSYYPGALTLSVADAAAIVATATLNWTINAAKGWLGTSTGPLDWFNVGKLPVSPRFDDPTGAIDLSFSPDKKYLYVVDRNQHRVMKYDYENQQYIGWTGQFTNAGGVGITGSNVNGLLNVQCAATTANNVTPGWCFGGSSTMNNGWQVMWGAHQQPWRTVDDGTYLYVTEYDRHAVNKYRSDTGEFVGWIGLVNSAPSSPGTGLSNSCSTTLDNGMSPGWCKGGLSKEGYAWTNGPMSYPTGIAYSATNGGQGGGPYIYVANRMMITRYNAATGAFMGWIGFVSGTAPSGPASDVTNNCSTTTNTRTPGWCIGGSAWHRNWWDATGAINHPRDIFVDDTNDILYVVQTGNGGQIAKWRLSTGAYIGVLKQGGGYIDNAHSMAFDGTYFYVIEGNRVDKIDTSGNLWGWLGKVSNNLSMSGNPGCSSLLPNENTPGWCLGGTQKVGMDESSLFESYTIELDGNGKLLTAQDRYPSIKRWNKDTGEYEGQLIHSSSSPKRWSISQEFAASYGYGDEAHWNPRGVWADATHLYQTEITAGRVKKINIKTGETEGWIGGITSKPTGGSSGCTSALPNSMSPGWCLGALPNPDFLWGQFIGDTTQGLMYQPIAVTGDNTYIYVVDYGWHRINKFNKATGAYIGWIGWISLSPTGGDTGCVGATGFTPGWCVGGRPTNANNGNGGMNNPKSIVHLNGTLYVFDNDNSVHAYSASSGQFLGWTGQINVTPTSGAGGLNCSGAAGTMTQGWCKGGQARQLSWSAGQNPGGGFVSVYTNGITTDGTNLYIANGYESRIDKFTAAGVYVASVTAYIFDYSSGWITNPTTWGWNGWTVDHIWADANYLYAVTAGNSDVVLKYDLSTGRIVGWQGAILPGSSPTAPAACAGAVGVTPTWCQNGNWTSGFTLGGFTGGAEGITGDAYYVYVTDGNSNRVQRFPK